MIVGFTGTRIGMSPGQLRAVDEWLDAQGGAVEAVHHGGAIGADAEFHRIAGRYVSGRHVHWSDREDQRAVLELDEFDVEYAPKPPLERNVDIVRASHVLLAVPEDLHVERLRSGTWATIRRAREASVPRVLFGRFGEVVDEVDLP